MKMQKLVSIVVPVYNAEKHIKETINTIKKQTYKNYEVIFIDDASTDKSVSIIESKMSEKMKLIKLDKNKESAVARNFGIENSKGRYICFLDADDLWENEKIEKQVKFMEQKQCAFSYTSFCYITEKRKICSRKVQIPEKLDYKQALKNTRILPSSAMFDIKLISKNEIKMVETELEDIATWWNILKNGYIAYGLNEVLVYYRKVKGSRSANKFKMAIKRWRLYRKNEQLSILQTIYYFIFYIKNAINKRKRVRIYGNRSFSIYNE